jgi:hypothetical protein
MQTTSFGSAKDFTLFIDNFSWYYHLKYKLEEFMKFEEYKTLVEKQRKKMIKILCVDNGGNMIPFNYRIIFKPMAFFINLPYHILCNKMEL